MSTPASVVRGDTTPSVVIWSPQLVTDTPPTIELFVTRGENGVGNGSDAFVADLLGDAGVEVPAITGWTMRRYRAHYFTSSPWPDMHWEDRWPFAWRFSIEVAGPPSFRGDSLDGRTFSAAVDDETRIDEVHTIPWLVLADFDDAESAEIARGLVAPSAVIRRAMDRFAQLQIDLGPLPNESTTVIEVEKLFGACTELGGRVHFFDSAGRKLEIERPG